MSANLDDARRAWEAAKYMQAYGGRTAAQLMGQDEYDAAARLLLTNAEAEYRAALIDAVERRFDALGIKVRETKVTDDGHFSFTIGRLVAYPDEGRVKAWAFSGDWAWADELRLYTAPEAKQMVLTGKQFPDGDWVFSGDDVGGETHRLTLPTIDGALIPGTYTGPDGAVIKVEEV